MEALDFPGVLMIIIGRFEWILTLEIRRKKPRKEPRKPKKDKLTSSRNND
jgi:hypothetical protein